MKYFLDCEFMEDGKTIELLSLSLVREDGRSLYVINDSADRSKANDWVKENVIPSLDDTSMMLIGDVCVRCEHSKIADVIRSFITDKPEFWGYYAAYDWVVFCQCFGKMIDLPKAYGMFCRDIIQECKRVGNPRLPEQGKGEHHCMSDARWNREAYYFLEGIAP